MTQAPLSAGQRSAIVVPDLAAVVEAATRRIVARIAQAPGRIAICLTGGSTPKPVYRRLAEEPYRSTVPWERIHWFWGDDRFVPLEDERSNAGMACAAFLDHLPIPPDNIHVMPTQLRDPHDAARHYQDDLKQFYGASRLDPKKPLFDMVLMGLGSDGHTASLFPHGEGLEERERWVVGVNEAKLAPFVPRVTLTFPALASTREMLFLVTGAEKRPMVARVFAGDDLPATHAYSDGAQVWLMDEAAAPEGVR